MADAESTSQGERADSSGRGPDEGAAAVPEAAANDDLPVFTLGIAMAGAISAGAYTAGVLDFLVRAVRLHNRMAGGPGGPGHRIAIKAMSGASAGGITAALAAAGFVEGVAEEADAIEEVLEVEGESQTYSRGLRILHEIWVDRVDLVEGDGLLGVGDLKGTGPIRSLLDAEVLDRQAGDALRPVAWDGVRHDWLAEDVDVFLTATGLDGVPYVAPFAEDDGSDDRIAGHPMARHGFARHFRLHGLGTAQIPSPWLEAWGDAGVPLVPPSPGTPVPFEAPEGEAGPDAPWGELRLTAFASGAFPGGLASRFMTLTTDEIWVGPWRVEKGDTGRGGALPLDVDWAARPRPSHPFFRADPPNRLQTEAVDGGVVNNEPFELVRFTLRPAREDAPPHRPAEATRRRNYLAPNPPGRHEADRAVIMIDPFPEGPDFAGPEPANPDRLLVRVIARLAPTLINQARFKPLELLRAADPEVRSRFLIAPSRRLREGEAAPAGSRRRLRDGTRGAEAIASGALGGFAGFLDRRFRQHDFILGQRNCQGFLLDHFAIAADNPVDHRRAPAQPDPEARDVPVLHLHPDLVAPIALPPWPRLPSSRLSRLTRRIDARLDRLAERALGEALGGLRGVVAGLGWRWVVASRVKRALHARIDVDLRGREQL